MPQPCWLAGRNYPLGSLRDVLDRLSQEGPSAYGTKLTWFPDDNSNGDTAACILSKLAMDICLAMDFIHTRNPAILHRDLKPENILIDARHDDPPSKWSARICDFGASKQADSGNVNSNAGTLLYMAPENFTSSPYSVASDIYSFAMCLLDVAVPTSDLSASWEDPPFSIGAVVRGDRPYLPKDIEETELGRLIEECWDPDPSKRPPSFAVIRDRIAEATKQ